MKVRDVLAGKTLKRGEGVGMTGHVNIIHRDPSGNIIDNVTGKNLVVNAGLAAIAGQLVADTSTGFEFDWIAIGTGDTAVVATNTALVNEAMRVSSTGTTVTTNVANDTAQYVGTFAITATATIQESGVFSSASAGTMLCRKTFNDINVASGDSLEVTWQVSFANSS